MTTCEQTELALTSGALSLESKAHVDGCASCRAFRDETENFLKDLALPEVSSSDLQRLEQLPLQTLAAFNRQAQHRQASRQWFGYVAAAAVGALVSAAVMSQLRPVPSPMRTQPESAVTVATGDAALHYSDDEVFPEVSWPIDVELEGDSQ